MRQFSPFLLSVSVLLILSLACVLPTVSAPTPDTNSLSTAIWATMLSAATETARAGIPVGFVDTPIPTLTLEPTLTPTATLSPTPIFTNTPAVPLITVSMDTNCRVGPGKIYDRVGALLIGETAEVVGRDYTGNYWYIRNPDQQGGFCWLWGKYATLTGNFMALPMFTPPPTPTPAPDFEATYHRLETCSGWWVDIELANTGGVAFQSISMTVRDTETDVIVSMYSDKFTDYDGCLNSGSKEFLNPGASPEVSSPVFTYDPSGHQLRATITLCTGEGQNGMCVTKNIKFKP